MMKWMLAVAFAAAFAAPAFAQKTDLPDRPLKRLKDFDQAPLKEGISALKASGECSMQYIVGVDGKAKDITADCSTPDMAPYAVRMIQTGEWESEITGGEFFDSFPIKQVFKYGSVPGQTVDPRGEKSPVMITGVLQKDIERAINQVDKPGKCDVKFTVGANGKPKDVVTNCDPAVYDEKIAEAMKTMEFEPGLKGGQPVDWPGMNMPVGLTKPNG